MAEPLVGILMGSDADWSVMSETVRILTELGVPCETSVISAHRTPDLAREYAQTAEKRGLAVLIAGAGGAAHLAGTLAANTPLPVLGVPIASTDLQGLDSLLSTVQMPAGVPVGTVSIGKAGARNAAILAAQILAVGNEQFRSSVKALKEDLIQKVESRSRKVAEMAAELTKRITEKES